MQPLKICYITAELAPLAKVGGLGDVAGALPRLLAEMGHDVRVFLPLYRSIEADPSDFEPEAAIREVPVRLGSHTFRFSIYRTRLPGSDFVVHCVHCPELYDREAIYTDDADEVERFLLLSKAAIESCQHLAWAPDVFHVNDWQTAIVPLYLRTVYAWDRLFASTRTLFTIHNIGYQGILPAAALPRLGFEDGRRLFDAEDLVAGRINLMKTGITYADLLSTVSPTYAEEIQTEAYGMGLDPVLRKRRDDLVGILNGMDESEWHPRHDRLIPFRYSQKSLWRKAKNKEHLLEKAGLGFSKRTPLLGMVSRLTEQKGVDLLIGTLPGLLKREDLRLVVVGTGERRYEQFFERLRRRFADKVWYHNGYSNELAHLVEAASDVFLMPSRYEPCGLNQMYSLKYGAVPIVRRTGGLADTVELFDPDTDSGTGIVFDHYTTNALRWALDAALELYRQEKTWRRMMLRGMGENNAWPRRAEQYAELYRRLATSDRRPLGIATAG